MHTPGPITCTCGGGLDTRVYHDRECPIRLLAAAPALLEALEVLVEWRGAVAEECHALVKARAAIAQAK